MNGVHQQSQSTFASVSNIVHDIGGSQTEGIQSLLGQVVILTIFKGREGSLEALEGSNIVLRGLGLQRGMLLL